MAAVARAHFARDVLSLPPARIEAAYEDSLPTVRPRTPGALATPGAAARGARRRSRAERGRQRPILFVLGPGCDPTPDIELFARECARAGDDGGDSGGDSGGDGGGDDGGRLLTVVQASEGSPAEMDSLLSEALAAGRWVLVRNLQDSRAWQERLAALGAGAPRGAPHAGFRLWATSLPEGLSLDACRHSMRVVWESPRSGRPSTHTRTHAHTRSLSAPPPPRV